MSFDFSKIKIEARKAATEAHKDGAFAAAREAGFIEGAAHVYEGTKAEIARLREALVFIHSECLKRPVDVRAIIKAIKEAEK